MDATTFSYVYKGVENSKVILPKAIEYIMNTTKNDVSKILTDNQALSAVLFIAKMLAYETYTLDYEVFETDNFEKFLGELMNLLYQKRKEINFNKQLVQLDSQTKIESFFDTNQIFIFIFKMNFYMTNLIISNCVHIGKKYHETCGLKSYFDFLNDEEFINQYIDMELTMWNGAEIGFVDYFLLNLSSLTKHSEQYLQKWLDLNAIEIFLKIANKKEMIKFYCLTAITNIADDKLIEQLTEITWFADHLVDRLRRFHENLVAKIISRRQNQNIRYGKKFQYETLSLSLPNNTSCSVQVVLNGLYKLAVNNKMKDYIYFRLKASIYLKTLLANGNKYELTLISCLLGQLSFNSEIAIDLSKENVFADFISNHASISTSVDTDLFELEIIKTCKQISWNMSEAKIGNKKPDFVQETNKKEQDFLNHIMISYNTGSRELCLKIKDDLEISGFKVWMDVSDIHGSSLDSMANAVENSCCVLMCVTEKYRQSINCQAEAQYAFKLTKPIIPCIMQKGCENVTGWLGIIIGDKIFVNFTKYEWGECIKRLKGEIKQYYKAQVTKSVQSHDLTAHTPSESIVNADLVQNWDKAKLSKWLETKDLEKCILDYVAKMDGKVIHQIYEMKKKAPEFFYQSMNKITDNDVIITAKFSAALDELFLTKH